MQSLQANDNVERRESLHLVIGAGEARQFYHAPD
jgi:hypothetical protein